MDVCRSRLYRVVNYAHCCESKYDQGCHSKSCKVVENGVNDVLRIDK